MKIVTVNSPEGQRIGTDKLKRNAVALNWFDPGDAIKLRKAGYKLGIRHQPDNAVMTFREILEKPQLYLGDYFKREEIDLPVGEEPVYLRIFATSHARPTHFCMITGGQYEHIPGTYKLRITLSADGMRSVTRFYKLDMKAWNDFTITPAKKKE